jgi:cytosine/adenosine deaminase-related metal-dependent hydrolase
MRALLAGSRYLFNIAAVDEDRVVDVLPITAVDVLGYATQGGARGAWLGDEVGSLTPGKAADIILVRTDTWGMQPLNYPVGAVVESGHPMLVETVLVDGELVKSHGQLVNHDFNHVRRLAEDARDRLMARAGIAHPGEWLPEVYSNQ